MFVHQETNCVKKETIKPEIEMIKKHEVYVPQQTNCIKKAEIKPVLQISDPKISNPIKLSEDDLEKM